LDGWVRDHPVTRKVSRERVEFAWRCREEERYSEGRPLLLEEVGEGRVEVYDGASLR